MTVDGMDEAPSLTVQPIGIVSSPHADRHSAPRQPSAARGVKGTITLFDRTGYEHALTDLDSWSHVWVIFWFHLNKTFAPKVLPPRSERKRGVFATRAPYRPNPMGLSLLRLERIEGRVLHVSDVDLLDGTPVLDLKPYVAYTDVAPDANHGWLDAPADPQPSYEVVFGPRAALQLSWLEAAGVTWLRTEAEKTLRLGPTPHPYRRIKPDGDRMRIAIKDFRMRFSVAGTRITVETIHSGYRKKVLADPRAQPKHITPLSVHRELEKRFGQG